MEWSGVDYWNGMERLKQWFRLLVTHWLDGIILNKFGFARKLTYFSQLLGPLIRKQYGLAENCLIQTTQALVVRYQAGRLRE